MCFKEFTIPFWSNTIIYLMLVLQYDLSDVGTQRNGTEITKSDSGVCIWLITGC